ncbi:hypothetical protein F5B22DRAFT_583435 [Xylaria bambusicola]|uniref:uncharacterized protein n=1 Tax=Xylaria bambusicola TaxID=326684 RepID=UPI002007CE77|nr:uncharacterized protein F5B22DRAFT_583435 [Xylaria bambusicola]KAI0528057.1 hypothetical protein F5B22DRAFT_583435 [Xylaria bambusicola]
MMAPSRISSSPPTSTFRLLPFSSSTTSLQAATYLLGISLFSISFLVFLNSAVSFVITDLLGVKKGVGDIVGTLGFADELVALVACPLWGLLSDRLGVRWVAVLGYAIIAISLVIFVQCRNVYPALILARILFAAGATAAATMVTAILPVLTGDEERDAMDGVTGVTGEGEAELYVDGSDAGEGARVSHAPRPSIAASLESDVTITPERFNESAPASAALNAVRRGSSASQAFYSSTNADTKGRKPSALAGLVGLFTGCGALVALVLFLPLPAYFSKKEGVTPAQAITESFYVVGVVSLAVAIFVAFGLRGLRGEEGKGWRMLLGLKHRDCTAPTILDNGATPHDSAPGSKLSRASTPLPYHHLLLSSLRLGATDPHIALGYLGGFVARASTVAISLFLPLYVNTYFMSHGFCQGSPNDPSPDLKRECRAAYVLAASLSGVAQLIALLCAPVFGYVNARRFRGVNWGVLVAASLGIVGYVAFPRLASPEFKDVDGRGGSAVVFLVVALLGISQIGAIVCSLGSLGRGVLGEDVVLRPLSADEGADQERDALLGQGNRVAGEEKVSRVQLKGSIAGVYSWCGGAAILLLTKLGGYLFDALAVGAPFYMMALFNAVLLVVSLGIDLGGIARGRR